MSLSRDIAESYGALIEEGHSPDQVADAIVSFLKENGLSALNDQIVEHVASIEEAKAAYQSVIVKFAEADHKRAANHIAHAIAGTPDVAVVTEEDADIIGGFKARYRGREWDASIAGALTRLRANLKQ